MRSAELGEQWPGAIERQTLPQSDPPSLQLRNSTRRGDKQPSHWRKGHDMRAMILRAFGGNGPKLRFSIKLGSVKSASLSTSLQSYERQTDGQSHGANLIEQPLHFIAGEARLSR